MVSAPLPAAARPPFSGGAELPARLSLSDIDTLRVKGTRVDNWLRPLVRTQNDKQIRNHLGPAFVIQGDYVGILKALKRLIHHGDGAFHNLFARCDDRAGLLSLEHRLRDLGGIGKRGDANLDDFQPRKGNARGHFLGQLGRNEVGSPA